MKYQAWEKPEAVASTAAGAERLAMQKATLCRVLEAAERVAVCKVAYDEARIALATTAKGGGLVTDAQREAVRAAESVLQVECLVLQQAVDRRNHFEAEAPVADSAVGCVDGCLDCRGDWVGQ